MEDITPKLLEQIRKAFRQNLKDNDKIADLTKKLAKGIATYQEADMYAVEVGQALAKAFAENVSSNTLPDGKMYYNIASRIIPPTLKESCNRIAEFAETIQKGMNERAGLGIKVQKARYNKDKEKGIIEHAAKAEKYDTVKKSTEDALVNMGQATVTDMLKENVEFQYKAGLSPKIIRTAAKGCCKWCDGLAGTYPYEDVRNSGHDVYRRHANCNCIVDYINESGRRRNVHSKVWYDEHKNIYDDIRKKSKDRLLMPPAQLEFAVSIENNPRLLRHYTPITLKRELESRGFEVKPLGRGKHKGKPFEEGGGYRVNYRGDGILEYHPAKGSRHGGRYYKISSAKQKTRWFDTKGFEFDGHRFTKTGRRIYK